MLQQINIKNSPSDVEPLKDHSFIPWCNLHKREKTKHKMQNIQYHSHKKWQKGKESDTERTQSHTWDLLGWGGGGGVTLDISAAAVVSTTRCWGQHDLMFFTGCQMIVTELPSWLQAEIRLSSVRNQRVCMFLHQSGLVVGLGQGGISCIM